jgi:translocation and assembly module TamA
LRARVFGDIGGAVFVEGGAVSEEVYFEVEDPSVAAGAGVRYYSPVGPIRFDVGVPLNPDDDDDNFQIYLSIGQAF